VLNFVEVLPERLEHEGAAAREDRIGDHFGLDAPRLKELACFASAGQGRREAGACGLLHPALGSFHTTDGLPRVEATWT
jgi:hypothetical protein